MTGRGQAWYELRRAGGRRCTLSAHEPASAVDQQDLGEAGADVHGGGGRRAGATDDKASFPGVTWPWSGFPRVLAG